MKGWKKMSEVGLLSTRWNKGSIGQRAWEHASERARERESEHGVVLHGGGLSGPHRYTAVKSKSYTSHCETIMSAKSWFTKKRWRSKVMAVGSLLERWWQERLVQRDDCAGFPGYQLSRKSKPVFRMLLLVLNWEKIGGLRHCWRRRQCYWSCYWLVTVCSPQQEQ